MNRSRAISLSTFAAARVCPLLLLVVVVGLGCSRSEEMPSATATLSNEAGQIDVSPADAGRVEAGRVEASRTDASPEDAAPAQSFASWSNSLFTPELARPDAVPRAQAVAVPGSDVAAAIWGATGRDDQGHVWFAVSPMDGAEKSARLYEYDPTADSVLDRGDVLSELRKANLYLPGMQQPKIHTKIIQAADRHLYFFSSDENPRAVLGRTAPKWGSHLWRLRMPDRTWEHLAAFDEGVLALAGGGNDLFGLAFPDHTLIHYDIPTGSTRKVAVGSVEGHVSRNLLADGNGQAYVPRLKMMGPDEAEHTLVAFDRDLNELGSHPIPYYQQAADQQPASIADQFHGITAFAYLADGSIVFTTHAGRLLHLSPGEADAGTLTDLGWLHPDGKSYATSLFTIAGERDVYGLPMIVRNNYDDHDLVRFDLAERKSQVVDLQLPEIDGRSPLGSSLYGSNTRDGQGAFVIAGLYGGNPLQPVLLRIVWDAKGADVANSE